MTGSPGYSPATDLYPLPVGDGYRLAKQAHEKLARLQNTAPRWNAAPVPWDELPPGQQRAWCRVMSEIVTELTNEKELNHAGQEEAPASS